MTNSRGRPGMGVAFAYLVDRRGAAFAFTELTHSEQVRDAIAREVAQNQ
jgi:hypothetical protein